MGKLKEALIKLLKEQRQEETITITKAELNKLIEDKANELVDKEIQSLGDSFLKEVSENMKVFNSNEDKAEHKYENNKEEVVRKIINQGDNINE